MGINLNKDFQSKQEIDFHTSKLKLSFKLGEHENWNEQTILERSKKLALEAIQIWDYPDTSYQKTLEEGESYTLDDDFDFRGKRVKRITIQEQVIEVKNWWFVTEKVCKYLFYF